MTTVTEADALLGLRDALGLLKDREQVAARLDESVQPLIRGVTRIHVVEESRHVRYAREELRRQTVTAPRWSQEFTRISSGEFARVFSLAFACGTTGGAPGDMLKRYPNPGN